MRWDAFPGTASSEVFSKLHKTPLSTLVGMPFLSTIGVDSLFGSRQHRTEPSSWPVTRASRYAKKVKLRPVSMHSNAKRKAFDKNYVRLNLSCVEAVLTL